ncbi:MAG: flagellar motor switch protein FliN [Caldimicrobium sp.]
MTEEAIEKEEQKVEEKQEDTALNPEDLMAMWEEALKEAQPAPAKEEPPARSDILSTPVGPSAEVSAQPVTFEELKRQEPSPSLQDIEFFLDVPLEISAELGRTKMLIKDLLKLNQGSIIELDKFAGEPVEIYVNGRLMAQGEVVVVNDRLGVRITEIISARDRIKKLGS